MSISVYVEGHTDPGASTLELSLVGWIAQRPVPDKVKVTVVEMDIDTDSDNDRDVDRSVQEDSQEDVNGSSVYEVGKRIFVNNDDDNRNGKADKDDDASVYATANVDDNDFAEIVLDTAGVPLKKLAGHSLWLGLDSGLNVWADKRKTPLSGSANAPDRTSNSWYIWDIDSTGGSFPDKLYVEGTEVAEKHVYWRLVKPGGTANNKAEVVARDTVEINVEDLVYPFVDQDIYNWYHFAASTWQGLNVGDAWYMDKTLVDYINTSGLHVPGQQGILETIHPDMDDPTGGKPLTWASREGDISTSKETYADGFTMEFDYSFEPKERGDGVTGYVQANAYTVPSPPQQRKLKEKLSFVGNSGVKFGTSVRPSDQKTKDFEIAILDVQSMVGKAGGLSNITIDGETKVVSGAYEKEHLSTLMTAVRYGGDFANMPADYKTDGGGNPDYPATLESQYSNRTPARMVIDAAKNGTTYTVIVTLGGVETYRGTGLSITGLDKLKLQSHWGSGVIFSNMNVTAK